MKDILKGTSKLFVSNLLSQGLSLILMIFVCRKYYSPSDLEVYTLFQSAIGFFGILFIFRLDTLFYIDKEKENRDVIYRFSSLLILFLSLIFFIVNSFFNLYNFNSGLNLLLPVGMILNGLFNLSQAKLINEQQFVLASFTRVLVPLINFITTYYLIVFDFKENAMIIGLVLGFFVTLIVQLFYNRFTFSFNRVLIKSNLRKYYKDILFSNLIYIINSFRDTLFILFISIMYTSKDYVASYSQALRIVSLPSLVLSGALGGVLGAQLKIDIEDKILFRSNYFKLLFYIIISSLIIYFIAFVIMDFSVEILFGYKWSYVSKCAKSMTPWLFMNFILNALNGYFLILRMQFINLLINIFEISFFISTFFILNNVYEFDQNLLFASLWSLFFGTLLIVILSFKIIKYSKNNF